MCNDVCYRSTAQTVTDNEMVTRTDSPLNLRVFIEYLLFLRIDRDSLILGPLSRGFLNGIQKNIFKINKKTMLIFKTLSSLYILYKKNYSYSIYTLLYYLILLFLFILFKTKI
uniref:Uncharacterized protein n=1 Tax=Cacopsylla melanoneura TaxID=428564 RepID=A0A8D9FF08_9HEMI